MSAEAKTVGELVERLPAPPAAVTPLHMLQMAVEKGAQIETLSKLLDLHERWEANEARKAFVHALSAFKRNPPHVLKNKSANYGGNRGAAYDYATLDQVCGIIGPELSRYGLSHRWETEQNDGKIKVTCVLTHEFGHSERVSLEAGADTTGAKNAVQAIGSTVTYLQRYTLLAVTGLAAKGQDDDGRAATTGEPSPNEPITEQQFVELGNEVRKLGDGYDRKLLHALALDDLESLADLPRSAFRNAMDVCKTTLANRAKKAGK